MEKDSSEAMFTAESLKQFKKLSNLDKRMAEDLITQIIMRLNDKNRDRKALIYNLKIGFDTEAKRNKAFVYFVLEHLKKKVDDEDIKKLELEI